MVSYPADLTYTDPAMMPDQPLVDRRSFLRRTGASLLGLTALDHRILTRGFLMTAAVPLAQRVQQVRACAEGEDSPAGSPVLAGVDA